MNKNNPYPSLKRLAKGKYLSNVEFMENLSNSTHKLEIKWSRNKKNSSFGMIFLTDNHNGSLRKRGCCSKLSWQRCPLESIFQTMVEVTGQRHLGITVRKDHSQSILRK